MSASSERKDPWEKSAPKIILGAYILFCLIVASLNFGYAPSAPPEGKRLAMGLWDIYENEFKTAMILCCVFLC